MLGEAPVSHDPGRPSDDLLTRLKAGKDFTPADRAIANYILINRSEIAFETGNSIAETLQMSATTIGRFSRKMGYRHFKDLKAGLRSAMSGVPWLVGDRAAKFVEGHRHAGGKDERGSRSLELEVAGLVEVYAMARTEGWKRIVALLAQTRYVQIAGFQSERGVAASLAHLLQYARGGVSLVDTSAGNYHETFADEIEEHCLVLVDVRRYSEQARQLAERAKREGVPLVMITDKFCDWIGEFTDHVIPVSTEVELFWGSQVSLSCAVNLLVNDVIGLLGTGVERRLERLSELYEAHTGHVGATASRGSSKV